MNKILTFIFLLFIWVGCSTYQPINNYSGENIEISGQLAGEDSEVVDLVEPYKEKLEKDMKRVLAVSDQEMVKGKPESLLTNFMSDLLLEEGQKYGEKNNLGTPEVAFVNYGGIRSSLPKGEINVQKIYELMPFENEMVFLKISGKNLKLFAERVAERDGSGVAGVTIGIKNQKLSSFLVAGKQVDESKSYWLVTNDYVASGGDKMDMFLNPEEYVSSGETIRDIMIRYMEEKNKEGKHISAKKDGRVFYEQ